MEGQAERQNQENRNRKRKNKSKSTWSIISSLTFSDTDTIFPLLLAATFSNSPFLVKKCLKKLLLTLRSKSSLQFTPIISLLPTLLASKSSDVAVHGAEIVGALSLLSLEMNERIACDSQTVKALVSLLPSSEKEVSAAACNALLDLCTTCLGRHRLLQFSALQVLMFELLQVPRSSLVVSLCTKDDGDVTSARLGIQEDELLILCLNAIVILINTCNVEQLEKIPRKFCERVSIFFKELWTEAHCQMLNGNILGCNLGRNFYLSNITINSLAESIFRLSLIGNQPFTVYSCDEVRWKIFCFIEVDFQNFLSNHWEVSPFLMRQSSIALFKEDAIFSSFIESQNCKEKLPSILSSILQRHVSCMPIASDELDILKILKEVGKKLGCPLIYEQDIRVLRTDKHSNQEVHFFQENLDSCCIKTPHFLWADDILKCEEAYKEGYTIAMRGMEFRSERVAAITDGLAFLFGQPSAGANLYLTPPNSQGLACHYDDHCVFVCQLSGTKHWKIYSQPNVQLPRLYDPCVFHNGKEVESSVADCYNFLLSEGDVLYIPRGFRHEAHTDNEGSNESAGFSLHLTLSIEVEPPFEWEGFLHVALFSWNRTQLQRHHACSDFLSSILIAMSSTLLHFVIGLFGASDPTFRKACLVAAVASLSDTRSWLDQNQNTTFRNLIGKISAESRFFEAIQRIQVAIENNEDPFQGMRWLQLLNEERETIGEDDWYVPFMGVQNIFPLYVQHKEMAEGAFMQVKAKFCSEVSYDDVVRDYKILHEKYKKVRKQYGNGMLSLHYN